MATGQVTVIDGATNATQAVPVGSYPFSIDVNMVTNKVYVANSASNTLTVIDGASNATTTVPVGDNPMQVLVDANTDLIYVVNANLLGTISVIDGKTNTVTDNIFAGFNPSAIAIDSSDNQLYAVAGANNNYPANGTTVYAFNGDSGGIVTNGVPEFTALVSNTYPDAMEVNPVTHQLFVSNNDGNAINVETYVDGFNKGYHTVGTGYDLGAVAINTATDTAYVADHDGSGAVEVVNGNTFAVQNIDAGPNPGGIAVDSLTNAAYVANTVDPGTVTIIDGITGNMTTVPVAAYPSVLAVNPVTNLVYVLNDDSQGTVSVIRGLPLTAAPVIGLQPQSASVNTGSSAAFSTAATGRPLPTYQWTLNGAPLADGPTIVGSTSPTLVVSGVTAAQEGGYSCTVSNSGGSATSVSATLSVVSTSSPGRIVNLSTRAYLPNTAGSVGGTNVLIAGFEISGQASLPLVLRGIGPTLSSFGVALPIDNPVLGLFDAATPANMITQDTAWQAPPSAPTGIWLGVVSPADATADDFSEVGAFALPSGSADTALKVALYPGAYTSEVSSATGASGVVLAEVYDDSLGAPGTQLTNVSSRAFVGDNGDQMIAGFVISGTSDRTVLIRASGPALGAFGFAAPLPDPELLLYDSGGAIIASNAGWGGNSTVAAIASRVGAFAWADPTSSDSALIVTLPPGAYTAEINPLTGDAGIALIEVYALP
jgi:YVTN family beta-propeller protein